MRIHPGTYIHTWQRYYNLMEARYDRRKRSSKGFTQVAKQLNLWYSRSTQLDGMQEQVIDRTFYTVSNQKHLRLVK